MIGLRLFRTLYRNSSLHFDPRLRSVCPLQCGKPPSHFAHAKDGFTHGLKDMSFMAEAAASPERGGGRLERFPALLNHRPSPETPLRPRPRSVSKSSRLPPSEFAGRASFDLLRRWPKACERPWPFSAHTGFTGSRANRSRYQFAAPIRSISRHRSFVSCWRRQRFYSFRCDMISSCLTTNQRQFQMPNGAR